jgi:glycerol transport system ATP-binding protein
MAGITLEGISHSYGPASDAAELALRTLDHTWQDGGAYALLGPSGCGKTTLLNIISGLLTPTHGKVLFNGEDVTTLAPEQRNIAQVFQFPVIYDTMTVAENLEFPLRNRGVPRAERRQRVAEVLEMLELAPMAHRKARSLGADQRQKISLGRGLVRTDANAILFDEPLTVIDPALKWQLRAELKKVHQQFSHTMIYVTHDQTEALTFADRVVVMHEGQVLQTGTPQQLFDAPAHTFVGRFIGSPGMNILACEVSGRQARLGDQVVTLPADHGRPGGELEMGIRPEHVALVEHTDTAGLIPVELQGVDDLGRYRLATLRLGGATLQALLPEAQPLPEHPALHLPPEHLRIYQRGVLLEPAA